MSFKIDWIEKCKTKRTRNKTKRVVRSLTWTAVCLALSVTIVHSHYAGAHHEAIDRLAGFCAVALTVWAMLSCCIIVIAWIAAGAAISEAKSLTSADTRRRLVSKEKSPENQAKATHGLFDPWCCLKFGSFNGVYCSVNTLSEITLATSMVAVGWVWLASLILISMLIAEMGLLSIGGHRNSYLLILDDADYVDLLTDKRTRPPLTCILCGHFTFDSGDQGYSDMTPGSRFSCGCNKHHFDFGPGDATEKEFAEYILTAVGCGDFDAAPMAAKWLSKEKP